MPPETTGAAATDGRVAARRAEVAALSVAEFAWEAYTTTVPETGHADAQPDHPLPVASGEPEAPLVHAVADLAAAAYAAGRAAHLAAEEGSSDAAGAAARAADAVADAARLGVDALIAEGESGAAAACERLAHAAAHGAHRAAEALLPYPAPQALTAWVERHHAPVPYPASWQRLNDDLTHRLLQQPPSTPGTNARLGSREALLAAARAACAAAGHCRDAYAGAGADHPAARASGRAARIAALAASYAGWAAYRCSMTADR